MKNKPIDNLSVSAIRSLVIDITNKAKSGHPGMALDIAPAVYALFKDHFVADPANPNWINRDRFILSSGHNSALLYALLHVSGYKVSLNDLKKFRQLKSITPGHPEIGMTEGVDATGGPLGQGVAQAVGVAMAEKHLRASYTEGSKLINHYTYCLCGDGCLEEGISQEAISLAGHNRLNKLILIYDENGATLDGPTSNSLSENVKLRFMASEWNVIDVKDGNNIHAISKAIGKAKKSSLYPTVIIVHTQIGYGSAFQGQSKTHGNPLGEEDGKHAKAVYGYNYPEFTVPAEVYNNIKSTFITRGQFAFLKHQNGVKEYAKDHKKEYKIFLDSLDRYVDPYLPTFTDFKETESSRNTSGRYIQALYETCPFTFGGAADVAGSVMTKLPKDPSFTPEHPEGRNINFGIREFGMASAGNGILLHKGLVPYVGCFLIFSDYMKNAVRMSALEELPNIYLFSHDSIAVGEDGPTHQPIETLVALRSIPNVDVIRPADAKETVAAWELALKSKSTPTCLILSRQNLPLLEKSNQKLVEKGAYVIHKPLKKDSIQLIATGSEVSLAINVAKKLEAEGIIASVVSMPSMNRFMNQSQKYIDSVLDVPYDRRVSIEMLSTFGWAKFAKYNLGIDEFGISAPAKDAVHAFKFDEDSITKKILNIFKKDSKK